MAGYRGWFAIGASPSAASRLSDEMGGLSMRLKYRLAVALLAVIAVGCASGPRVVSSWRDPAYAGPAFKKVAVVGLTNNDSTKRVFESVFATKLRAHGIEAVAAYEANPTKEKLPRDEMERIIKENGIDAIITARVVDRKQETQVSAPTTVAAPYPAYYGDYYGFYDYSWGFYHDPGYVYSYEVVSIETNVYETSRYGIVWTGMSETTDPTSVEQESAGLADGIIKELVANGLLAP
jgi:hypothetical protein